MLTSPSHDVSVFTSINNALPTDWLWYNYYVCFAENATAKLDYFLILTRVP
jgi:hypothetical protein